MKFTWLIGSAVLAAGLLAGRGGAVEVGDKAPEVVAKTDANEVWKLEDHKDETVVFFFFPAAMTGGCTKQACAYRDDLAALKDLGAVVVGVSGDKTDGLALFSKVHKLGFPLLSDYDGKIAEGFGVPTGKGGSILRTVDDKEFTLERGITAKRWTFVVQDGKVVYKNDNVNAAQDSKAVMEFIKK